jgi:hypothetical protein
MKYRCDHCGKSSNSNIDFREVVGNIIIPGVDGGGLVGNNIFTTQEQQDSNNYDGSGKVERCRIERGKIPISIDSGNVRVYSNIFCIDCFLSVSGITKDGKSKY